MNSDAIPLVAEAICNLLCANVRLHTSVGPGLAQHDGQLSGLGWHALSQNAIPRTARDVFVEPFVRETLIRLNPEIADQPDRAEQVLFELRAILRAARSDGLIKANKAMTEWFRNEKSMPFGENYRHTPVQLFDFHNIENNHFVVTPQYRVQGDSGTVTADLVLLVNGFPLVVVEAKAPLRPSVEWFDGAVIIRQEYEKTVPELFVCNVFNVATDGRQARYGSIGMPENLWGPWRAMGETVDPGSVATVSAANLGMLAPAVLLDILEHFTLFAVNDKKRLFKVVCRYQQYQATNLIVDRVVDPSAPKKGLIWHFQGSGKSYLMVFAAKKLRQHPKLGNPSVLVVVDRVDLDAQISSTFFGAGVKNLEPAKTRAELKALLRAGARKVIITTVFRFGDASAKQEANSLLRTMALRLRKLAKRGPSSPDETMETLLLECSELVVGLPLKGTEKLRERLADRHTQYETVSGRSIALPDLQFETASADDEGPAKPPIVPLNESENVVVLVDEAHRTQEGDLGMRMRGALPNATFFGLTGTPIKRRDLNTFRTFGAECDHRRYLHRYGFEDSIRDGATLPLKFVPRKSELRVDADSVLEELGGLTDGLSDADGGEVIRRATRIGLMLKAPKRVRKVVKDIVDHFRNQVRPLGLAAMVVTYDREACLLYKEELDKHLSSAVSDVVFSVGNNDEKGSEYKKYRRDRDEEEKLLDRLRDPRDPFKLLIVTAKLLTGFDAPIVQTMYLDKPMRDHTLLQAICRTNRVYNEHKQSGIIVDYLGLFDKTANALKFDEEDVNHMVESIEKVKDQLQDALTVCLAFFEGVDRTLDEEEDSHIAALNKLGSFEQCDRFGKRFRYLSKVWEVVSPDPILAAHVDDYAWLSRRYRSIRKLGGGGRQVWQKLGPQTTQLLYKHLSFNIQATELEDIILDDELYEVIQHTGDPKKVARDLSVKLEDYLNAKNGDPQVPELAARLQELKKRYESGTVQALDFIRELLRLSERAVRASKQNAERPPKSEIASEDRGKAMLTKLFEEIRTPDMPVTVEKVVIGIDAVVRKVRFEGWAKSSEGRRDVSRALRKALFDHLGPAGIKAHEQALAYVQEYY